MHEFHPWSWTHVVVLIVTAVVVTALCAAGRVMRKGDPSGDRERRARHAVAWLLVAIQVFKTVWWMWPTGFDVRESLPLQVCDILEILVPIALLAGPGRGWVRVVWSLIWFAGIGLSTQAYFTPVLTRGPSHVMFWLFWHGHGSVLACGVYLVAVLGYRPTLRDFLRLLPIGVVYVAAMLGVNHLTGANYAFVGDQVSDRPTLIDRLGPWPLRVVWLCLLSMVAMLLTWVPFGVLRAFGKPPRPSTMGPC